MNDLILAIDPGKSGGFAWCISGGTPACAPMPDTEAEVVQFVQELTEMAVGKKTVFIEKVGGFTGSPQPGSRMFVFGRNTGILLGALYAEKFRIIEVPPAKWQKQLSLTGIDVKKRKNEFKNRARQLFPALEKGVTLKTADALLIFEYACQTLKVRTL